MLTRRQLQRTLIGLTLSGAAASNALASVGPARLARTLNLAVAQMRSVDGDLDGNLRRASRLAEDAAIQGARLILFPEFMPTGYALNESIWRAAEPANGRTVRWLAATSRRLGVWIGTTYLEASGEDFFDTFVLTGPDGREAGRVRKETPASLEAAFIKGEAGPHLIDTPLGRIGVGICFESYICSLARHFAAARPDFILLPHSFPGMAASGRLASPPGTHVAGWYARQFGVPVAMCNKTGDWRTTTPDGEAAVGRFPGASAIVDSDGAARALMDDQTGVKVARVRLDADRKVASPPPCVSDYITALALPFAAPSPQHAELPAPAIPDYASNPRRIQAALAVSGARR